MTTGKQGRAQLNPGALRPEIHVPASPPPEAKKPRGRPTGALGRLTRASVEHAQATGEMPHYFLLRITRGEVISTDVLDPITGELKKVYQVPDLNMRVDAAKAAAPYFAPKLSAVEVLGSASDAELDDLIRSYGAEAGLRIGTDGEGAQGEDQDGAAGPSEDSWL